jgi:outer membrane lipase/esterase
MFEFLRARRRALAVAAASAATVFLVSCSGSDGDVPPLFSSAVTVGASGADTGNRCGVAADPLCFPVPPYAGKSTAANGKLYPELVAAKYGAPLVSSAVGGTNYAVGGARTGTIPGDTVPATIVNLQVQLEQYLAKQGFRIDPSTLVIVDGSAFGNNIRRALELLRAIPPANQQAFVTGVVSQAAADIYSVVLRAYSAGARHVLLTNSSDLGLHPVVRALGAQAAGTATAMAMGFNGALASQVVPQLRATLSGLELYTVDFGKISQDVNANPQAFGFANAVAPCYPFFSAPTAPACASPDLYVWWDELHPTSAVHSLLAQRAIAAIGK